MQRMRPQRQRNAQKQGQQQQQKEAQATDQIQETALITAEQSLRTVKKLVETSIGCLMYLRGFFDDQNFEDELVQNSMIAGDAAASSGSVRNDAPIKVKRLKKGVTKESDIIMKLWEEGIQDALDKNYLSSLILGIYLDENNDNELVEAYTFNFTYGQIEGINRKVPILNLASSMQNFNIYDQGAGARTAADGSAENLSAPKIKTIIDVRRQIQALLGIVPIDYEPPGFVGGESKERLLFSTASIADRPDQINIGSLDTGFHGRSADRRANSMSIHLATLAPFLRRAQVVQGMTVFDIQRADEALQAQDAAERRVIWDAEEPASTHRDNTVDADAVGEPDLGLTEAERRKRDALHAFNRRLGLETNTVSEPVGVRLADGKVAPVPPSAIRKVEDRQEKRDRGEPVSDDEDLYEPVSFVLKHIKEETQNVMTPNLANALIAESIISPLGGMAATTITGTSRVTERSQPRHEPAPPSDFSMQELHEQAGDVRDTPADRLKDIMSSSTGAYPSSPLANRIASGSNENKTAEAATELRGGDVPMELDQPDRNLEQHVEDDVPALGDQLGDNPVDHISMTIDADETQEHVAAPETSNSVKSFPPSQQGREEDDQDDTIKNRLSPASKTSSQENAADVPSSGSQRSLRPRKTEAVKESETASQQTLSKCEKGKKAAKTKNGKEKGSADRAAMTMTCACDDPGEGGLIMECDICNAWVHAACYGYRGIKENDLPEIFECYSCRVKNADLLTEDEKTKILAELGTLALTRHALDLLYTDGWPGDRNKFAKLIGASLNNARSILKVCESEGFIRHGADGAEATGGNRSAKTKAKAIAAKSVTVLKGKAPREKLVQGYFTAGEGAEKEIMKPMSDSVASSQVPKDDVQALITRTESLNMTQKAPEAPNRPTGSSSQTAIAHLTSTTAFSPIRTNLPASTRRSARLSSPVHQKNDAANSPRSASKRKADESENLNEHGLAELAKKRRAKTSRQGLKIALGDY
ncbi:hypothetical protein OC861_001825 [Tilletia horrida]|nr:hypothetical protein OC861_001825 [Tilletia horrida]